MAKDYYLILGVPLDASPRVIRSAFRELARRHHPDHAGRAGALAFQEAAEAYRVLSDPERRAAYDSLSAHHVTAVPPYAPRHDPPPWIIEPVPLEGETPGVRPSFEALFERLVRGFTADDEPKAEHEEPLDFELILNPEEADQGVLVPFEVPVLRTCAWCGGSGTDWGASCRACGAEGRLVDREIVHVRVPRGVRSGTVIEASLEPVGVRNLWLRLHTRIARH